MAQKSLRRVARSEQLLWGRWLKSDVHPVEPQLDRDQKTSFGTVRPSWNPTCWHILGFEVEKGGFLVISCLLLSPEWMEDLYTSLNLKRV